MRKRDTPAASFSARMITVKSRLPFVGATSGLRRRLNPSGVVSRQDLQRALRRPTTPRLIAMLEGI